MFVSKKNIKEKIIKIAEVGRAHKSYLPLNDINIFSNYFLSNGFLNESELNFTEGTNCSRREILARYLFLNSVLDQGPDMEGVRLLLSGIVNKLYSQEIRILHNPLKFFEELGIVINDIDDMHDFIKYHSERPKIWAKLNNANANRYNLFNDNCHQTISNAIFRWGVPLAIIYVLSKISDSSEALLDYLEDERDKDYVSSAEVMSWKIKSHPKYGLSKSIGDKAAHLFAKWITYTYPISRKTNNISWGKYSFEPPFDSNAGRVLFRMGFFFHFFPLDELIKYNFVIPQKGKKGNNHIQVTNIRGYSPSRNIDDIDSNKYVELNLNHLKAYKRPPRKIEIQKIPSTFLLEKNDYSVGEFDDGLMYVGTNYCLNIENPKCKECPLTNYCDGVKNKSLILDYRT